MSEDTQDAFERGFMLGFDEGVKQGKELGRQIPTYPTTHHNCLSPSVIGKPE
jgi:flagellar biosynthesis/type III secretory pathway protein FliH